MFITAGNFESVAKIMEVEDNDAEEETLGLEVDEEVEDEESFDYVVGFVGHKLGYEPSTEEKPDSWIAAVGGKKLHHPNEDLKDMCRKCNVKFNEFHGNSLKNCKDPLLKLENLIKSSFPGIPRNVSRLFCKVRFFSRLRRLNQRSKDISKSNTVRALKQKAQFLN